MRLAFWHEKPELEAFKLSNLKNTSNHRQEVKLTSKVKKAASYMRDGPMKILNHFVCDCSFITPLKVERLNT